MTEYKVRPFVNPIRAQVEVPGSKSMTNRALFMAAMAKETTLLKGVLFSDDSRFFLSSLQSLGFDVHIDEEKKEVVIHGTGGKIPNKEPEIYVGSAGTAARFLTAFLALNDVNGVIHCSEQMAKRPMKSLFDALTSLGAEFEWLGEKDHLPVRVRGKKQDVKTEVNIDISKSTQFLSALMMSGPLFEEGLTITVTSHKKTGSYVRITQKMMEQFGCQVVFDGNSYLVLPHSSYECKEYQIEPDVSAADYFYAMALLTGSAILVKNVYFDSMQGDIKLLDVFRQMGCDVREEEAGIRVTGRTDMQYDAVTVDMNDFSDQTMTLATVAAYLKGVTRICNVGHIRGQESNRMLAIVTELNKVGIECFEDGDDLVIRGGIPKAAAMDTYEDHRMAMAFSLLGLRTEGIVIKDPLCCRKTFENYFTVLDSLIDISRGE